MLGSADFLRWMHFKKHFCPFVVTMAVFLHWVHPHLMSEATGSTEYQSAYKQVGGVSRVMAFVWERASWGAYTHLKQFPFQHNEEVLWKVHLSLIGFCFLSFDAGIHSFLSMFHYSFLIDIANTPMWQGVIAFAINHKNMWGSAEFLLCDCFADLDKHVTYCSHYIQSSLYRGANSYLCLSNRKI